jgi:DNA (cytosine-5)-methyltransferase 1
VIEGAVEDFSATGYDRVDLLAGGVPCPPFSKAGKQLGADDERDMFPQAMRLIRECKPRAVMLENVRGLLDPKFDSYRDQLDAELEEMDFVPHWDLFNASDYGVPQLRPRTILVAIHKDLDGSFDWPKPALTSVKTVGEALHQEMKSRGWNGADAWAKAADRVAPTLVGGSKKHGGPDLGPTRARRAWANLGVEGRTIAEEPPAPDHLGMPRLTVKMAAIIQGFPPDWEITGKKTAAYRQIGNAFPPPVAKAVGTSIARALGYEVKQTEDVSVAA